MTTLRRAATLLVSRFRPREVLFSGIAGGVGPELRPGDIVIASRTVQHDFGQITDKGFRPGLSMGDTGQAGPRFIPADARLLALARKVGAGLKLDSLRTTQGDRQPAIRTGVVATGDVFVASKAKTEELRKVFGADAVEMEGAAVAQVCARLGAPCLIIRSISDSADAEATIDVNKFMTAASANSAAMVGEIVKALAHEAAPAPAARP